MNEQNSDSLPVQNSSTMTAPIEKASETKKTKQSFFAKWFPKRNISDSTPRAPMAESPSLSPSKKLSFL